MEKLKVTRKAPWTLSSGTSGLCSLWRTPHQITQQNRVLRLNPNPWRRNGIFMSFFQNEYFKISLDPALLYLFAFNEWSLSLVSWVQT